MNGNQRKYRVYVFQELWLTADEIFERLERYQAMYERNKNEQWMPGVQLARVALVNIRALQGAIKTNNLPHQQKLI